MLNDLQAQLKREDMLQPGDRVNCAVSGGADSMALLWGLYLLRDKLDITLTAAHFNHGLRGAESDADEAFVRAFCDRYDIPLSVGCGNVTAGEKGLEAAARDARYAFLGSLPGKVATAHTADDNAETLLMHLIRGTGLKGLGAIAPVNGNRIRPMLHITRQQVLAFLEEYHIPHREDSSNAEDIFLRNRIRHHIMPLLKQENPRISQNLSATATRLRQDEAALSSLSDYDTLPDIPTLRRLPQALRSRVLEQFLTKAGVREPEAQHIAMADALVFSHKPSAKASFPGGVTLNRNYDRLEVSDLQAPLTPVCLPLDGSVLIPQLGLRVTCTQADTIINTGTVFTVTMPEEPILRCRQSGDTIRLSGGTKPVKKLFSDRKIPAAHRPLVPIVADNLGVLGIYGIGVNLERAANALPALQIRFEPIAANDKTE